MSENGNNIEKRVTETVYFLSQIIDAKVIHSGKRIGKLSDMVIVESGKVPEVSHLYIKRPFGEPSLLVPWEKVKWMSSKELVLDLIKDTEPLKTYEGQPAEGAVLLKDHILDKKVLDTEGHEVEVVYDVKMVLRNNKFYVSDVDLSRYGLLRRIGLKWLANFIYKLADKIKSQTISWKYIEPLPSGMSSFKGDVKLNILKDKLEDIPPVDLADILEEMDRDQRVAIFDKLDPEQASETLEELDPSVQRDLIGSLTQDKAAKLINDMTPGQAADILSVLPQWEVKAILKLLQKENAAKIQDILKQQEAKIVDFAVMDCIKFPPEKTVGQALAEYHETAKGKDVIMYVYVVDAEEKLLGVIDLKELLQADPAAMLKDVMVEKIIHLTPRNTLKAASAMFARYGFRALPIMDDNNKLLGVVPYRDVMNLKHLFI